ncbi:hypothetical protein [Secundilactobacillus malefermentans]|uniref:hypothetical protein n=1 Tax=Secundilactobacillus malefermentans TaxID=176292 RepID=UPI0011C96E1D|nr:hypothetical protein [Secundilactobacillus malefermentans]QEA30840.1 hypothetical protein FGL90_00810 [Secundilactobacillus malefermentans]
MKMTLEIVIALLIALFILWFIRRFLLRRMTNRLRDDAKRQTDRAMAWALEQAEGQGLISNRQRKSVNSKGVADVWGRGVMAFEYTLKPISPDQKLASHIKEALNSSLQIYSKENKVHAMEGTDAFSVTDMWLYKNELHVDVAYLMNESTVEYLRDLKKLDEEKELP